ncbi:hypothetical protein UlMin_044340, partial [Ulmus minor]
MLSSSYMRPSLALHQGRVKPEPKCFVSGQVSSRAFPIKFGLAKKSGPSLHHYMHLTEALSIDGILNFFFLFPSTTPAFGSPSTPSFGGGGLRSSLFSTPFSSQIQTQTGGVFGFSTQTQQQQQQQQPGGTTGGGFGFSTPLPTPPHFSTSQLTTQMASVAPIPFSHADGDIQAILDAYKDEPGNPKYAFQHLLFSVTDPQFRVKPSGISDIMWAEAMETADRERLWPQLVHGFKDLSRLKLQDEVILSDAERLRMTQSNVKMLQRHFQADTLPWIERMRQKEQGLQRCLLGVMRIVEALEGKDCRLPLMKGEVELAEKLACYHQT